MWGCASVAWQETTCTAGLTSFTTLKKVGCNVALNFLHLVHKQRSSEDLASLVLHLPVGMDSANRCCTVGLQWQPAEPAVLTLELRMRVEKSFVISRQ